MKFNLAGCSRVLLINCAVVLLSLWIGVALNRSFVFGPQEQLFSYTESEGKREFKPLTASEAKASARFEEIQLEELKTVVAKQEAVLLDGRSEKDYENGHIAGAYSLSAANFDKRFPGVSSRFSKDDRLVVYCGAGDCSLSRLLAERLSEKGYSRIRIYFGGYTQWFLGNNPVVKGKETH
jgi:rhodanese-related sulfurtransferase